MIKEALQYLVNLGEVEIKRENGQTYSTQPLYLIKNPIAQTVTVNTLTGLVDYLKSSFDEEFHNDSLMVHVASPTHVSVYSHLNDDMTRNAFIEAKAFLPEFRFGRFYDPESFNIALQAVFVSNDDLKGVLKLVGNIKDDNITLYGDDGISQQVTAKMGVATVAHVKVPNPVRLSPYRTFVEVSQPESNFVFRMHKGQDGPECALFEADGGAWRNTAMQAIMAYLQESLEAQIEIGNIVLIV